MRNRAVGIVLYKQQILLMFRRSKGREYFVIPGGGIESTESPTEAVVREIFEETSVQAADPRLLYEIVWDNGDTHWFFLLTYIQGVPALHPQSPEMQKMRAATSYYEPMWVPLEKLADLRVYPLEIRDLLIQDVPGQINERCACPRRIAVKLADRRE